MEKTKVSLQGEPGAFHHLACEKYFSDNTEIIFRKTFEEVFDDLASGNCDYAIAATQNTEFGIIPEVAELMDKHRFAKVDDIKVHVNFCLLGLPGSNMDEIREVYSQAPALTACDNFIAENLNGAKINQYYDTAGAAKLVSDRQDPALAAIASKKAGEIYGLQILAEDIENHRENITQFVVLRADSKR